jgi:hypothetical protein
MFVGASEGPQTVQPYSSCDLVMALKEVTRVSFCFPQSLEAMALMIFRDFFVLSMVFLM